MTEIDKTFKKEVARSLFTIIKMLGLVVGHTVSVKQKKEATHVLYEGIDQMNELNDLIDLIKDNEKK